MKYTKTNPLKVVTLCSGYDSQCLALERLKRGNPEFDYELIAWSEIEFHVERRLGCMACPLASRKQRVAEFKKRPKFVLTWLKAGQKFRDTHPHVKSVSRFADVYEWFYFCLFEDYIQDHEQANNSLFGKPDYKQLLEDFFKIDLTI